MKKFFSKKATANSDAVNTAASAPATEMEKAADNAPKKITYTRLFIRDFLEIALGTLIPLLLFGKILGLSICPSPSMCPTIPVGEIYVINRLVAQDEQARGTIINFWDSEHTHHICKRVIGVPGDTLSIHDGKVYINGEELDESEYLEPGVVTWGDMDITIPEGRYFVMGDNRDNSYDSRYWLFPLVYQEDILGVYMAGVYIPILSPALAAFITGEPSTS